MAQHICWEICRAKFIWTCTEDNPVGFAAEFDQMLELRQTTPENTIRKIKLANGQGGRMLTFEFRWWRGTYGPPGPDDTRPPRSSAARI
jgi:hypothetical protein